MPKATVGSVDRNTVYTARAHNYLTSEPVDNYFRITPTLTHLRSKQKSRDGGMFDLVPIAEGGASQGGAVSRAQKLNPVGADPVTSARYEIAVYAEPIVIYLHDELKWGGEEAQFSGVEANTKKAKGSLMERIAEDVYDDGTAANELKGLAYAVADDPTDAAYGGLDGGTTGQAFWINQQISAVGPASTNLIPKMRTLWNRTSKSKSGATPTLIAMSQDAFEAYESVASNHLSLTAATSSRMKHMADLGFATMGFKGTPVVWDPFMDADEVYFINDEAVQLENQTGYDFVLTPFESTYHEGLLARVAWIIWVGQVVTYNRRNLGKLWGITF